MGRKTVALHLNDGTGGFGIGSPIGGDDGSFDTSALKLADLNHDGHLDLAVGDRSGSGGSAGVLVYLNQGDGTFPASGTSLPVSNAPRSIAVADIDADGDLDLAVGRNSEPDRIFVNDGNGGFGTSADIGDARQTNVVAFADIDGDGDPDLVQGIDNSPFLSWRRNDGSMNFDNSFNIFPSGESVSDVVVTDLDRDGDLDIIAAVSSGSRRNRVFLNLGASTFDGGTEIDNASENSLALALADFDRDGTPDLAIANDGDGSQLYPGQATRFGVPQQLDSIGATSLEFGDTSGDGHPDLAVGRSNQQSRVYVSDDGFLTYATRSLPNDFEFDPELAMGDLDGDGDLDVVIGHRRLFGGEQNSCFINQGNGQFVRRTLGASDADETWAVALGDVNSDGQLDVVAGNINGANRLYLNDGAGGFPASGTAIGSESEDTRAVRLADVNDDGHLDLLTGSDGANLLYLNDGDGGFPASTAIGNETEDTRDLALADLDRDGDPDLVASNFDNTVNRVYDNVGGSFPGPGVAIGDATNDTGRILAHDVNADGWIDVVAGNLDGFDEVYINDGTGQFQQPIKLTTGMSGDSTIALAGADFDGDGDYDLAVGAGDLFGTNETLAYRNQATFAPYEIESSIAELSDPTVSLLALDVAGDGTLTVLLGNDGAPNRLVKNSSMADIGTEADNTSQLVAGDFNRDGRIDVFAANRGQTNKLYLNNGAGLFPIGVAIGTQTDDTRAAVVGDVDRDGDLDLIVGNHNQVNRLYLNDGSGGFDNGQTVGGETDATRALVLIDQNLDGRLDLIVGNSNQPNRVYLQTGSGFPATGTPLGGNEDTRALAVADLNRDGYPDLLAGNFNQVDRAYLNNAVGGFTAPGVALGGVGATRALATLDVDLDGHVDILAGRFNEPDALYRQVDSVFGAAEPLGNQSAPTTALTIADLDSDGRSEVLAGRDGQAPVSIEPAGYLTHRNRAASLRVNTLENINTAILTAIDQANDPATRNTAIRYFLSNDGGGRWYPVQSGVPFTFPQLGNDLRWQADFSSLSTAITPELDEIQIVRINTAPAGQDGTVVTNEDTPYTFQVADFGYSDLEVDPLTTVRIVSLPAEGELQLDGVAVAVDQVIPAAQVSTLEYLPLENVFGNARAAFQFAVRDPYEESPTTNTLTIDVTAVNDPPVAGDVVGSEQNLSASAEEYIFQHADLLANSEPGPLEETQTLQVVAVSIEEPGTAVAVNEATQVRVTVPANHLGLVSFDFTVQDSGQPPLQDTAKLRFSVVDPNDVNQAPTVGTIDPQSFPAGVPFSRDLKPFFDDDQGVANLSFQASFNPEPPAGTVFVSGDGVLQGTATTVGTHTVQVTATDQGGKFETSEPFSLDITNDPPTPLFTLGTLRALTAEDRVIDVAPAFFEPDGQPLTFSRNNSNLRRCDGSPVGSAPVVVPASGLVSVSTQTAGCFTVSVRADDGFGGITAQDLSVDILEPRALNYRFERFFPSLQQPWYFTGISDLVVAPDDTVFVADAARGKIFRYSRDGLLITLLGNAQGSTLFGGGPIRVAADGDSNLYTLSGSELRRFSPNGTALDNFDFGETPLDLAIGLDGRLFIAFADRVEVHEPDDINGDFDIWLLDKTPAAITVSPIGRLYASLRVGNGPASEVVVLDAGTGAELFRFGTVDAQELQADRNGDLYAAGPDTADLIVYDPDGAQLTVPPLDLADLAVAPLAGLGFDSSNRLYVASQLSVFGIFPSQPVAGTFGWQSASTELARLGSPVGLDALNDETVYIAEALANRVQRFRIDPLDPAGQVVTRTGGWPLPASAIEPVTRSLDLRVTSTNRVLVAADGQLNAYDLDGNPDLGFDNSAAPGAGPLGESINGRLVLTTDPGTGFQVRIAAPDGSQPGPAWDLPGCTPRDLEVGRDNLVYVLCDTLAGAEIRVMRQSGDQLRTFSNLPDGEPRALALDLNDRIHLVLDAGSGSDARIAVLQSDGVFTEEVGRTGYSAGRFDFAPRSGAMALSPANDRLFVADSGNSRVQVLRRVDVPVNTKAIVVAGGGDYPENYLWEATQINTNNAYDKLIYQGFTADQILYLHPDTSLDLDGNPDTVEVDGPPTLANLQAAFADGGFAADANNLVVYLADHGDVDVFRLNPLEVVDAATVDALIHQLQDQVWASRSSPAPPTGLSRGWVTVLYEACESGSFQDDLAPLQGDGIATSKRLVITTSNEGQNANFVAQGFLSFSYQFWINIFNGLDVQEAFEAAAETVQETYAQQDPILRLVDSGQDAIEAGAALDGFFANTLFGARVIGNGTANFAEMLAGPTLGTPQVVVPPGSASGEISIDLVNDPDGVARVWIVIRPPAFATRDSSNPVLELPTIDLLPDPADPDRYVGTFANFTTDGTYRIDLFAQDDQGNVTQYMGPPLTVAVGNPPANKAIVLASGDGSPRGLAFREIGEFAFQALLRQDYVNDEGTALDEIRYFTQDPQNPNADGGQPTIGQLNNLLGAFVDPMTQNLVLYVAADYDAMADAFLFPGLPDLAVPDLVGFLATAEAQIQGNLVVVLEGNDAGTVLGRLVAESPRRFVLSATAAGGVSPLTEAGGVSFSRFFWNSVRDGFSLAASFRLARSAITGVAPVQRPLFDDSGNGIANERDDGRASLTFFLGPGIRRAGNGPLVGTVPPDQTIANTSQVSATILARDVSGTSPLARVLGSVAVPAAGLELGTFELTALAARKGGGAINLGDFSGRFDGFNRAGDYVIAVYALDDNDQPSSPRVTTLRKTAGPDIYEQDDTANTATQIRLGAAPQRHTLHALGLADPLDDADWLLFTLADEPARLARLNFSEIDPALDLDVQVYDDARLADATALPVLTESVPTGGATTAEVLIPDSLAAGRYLARISGAVARPAQQLDPSPGYSVGLADPFGDLVGELAGRVVDAQTLEPLGALVLGINASGEAGRTFSCFRNCGGAGGEGGFRLPLVQGSYDLQVLRPGYQTLTLGSFSVRPGATTQAQPSPLLLNPEAGVTAPSVGSLSAAAAGQDAISLSGLINANGTETNGRFRVAPSGGTLAVAGPVFLLTGGADQPVTAIVDGLDCETAYDVQLVASNAGGERQSVVMATTSGTCDSPVIFADGFE